MSDVLCFYVYADSTTSPQTLVVGGINSPHYNAFCEQIIHGVVAGFFKKVEGLMNNGQRFIMRKKEPLHGNETYEEFAVRTYGRLGSDFELVF